MKRAYLTLGKTAVYTAMFFSIIWMGFALFAPLDQRFYEGFDRHQIYQLILFGIGIVCILVAKYSRD